MDRDKLNDACDTAFLENYFPSATESPDPRWEMFADGFKQGTSWLMQQPLADRLTDEEKERIKAFYNGDTFGELDFIEIVSTRRIFKNLFGKDLFKEK